jgi:HD-GYP domain-containing protein (c-di-GMP phosphodiesterase class II)
MEHDSGLAEISTGTVCGLLAADVAAVDVYLPGAAGKAPVLYRGARSDAQAVDLQRLRQHGVSHVYVRGDALHNCERAIEQRLSALLANPRLASADKAHLLHTAGVFVARELLNAPTPAAQIERAAGLADRIIEGLLHDPEIAAYLLQMAGHERSTASHMQMVSSLAVIFGAEVMGDDVSGLKDLALAGLLHDVGKLSIPSATLQKKGPLEDEEVRLVHQHPIESVRLIGSDANVSINVRQIILQHHERLDGRGYPLGLTARDLPLPTRILSIVDSFHAMIGPRAYRAPLSVAEANRIMALQAGTQFDKDLLTYWAALCARQADIAPNLPVQVPAGAASDILSKGEQTIAGRSSRTVSQRRPRYACAGNAKVRCIYAGRLIGVTPAPDDFGAPVHDVSRSGLCIYSTYPMYRGEILHIRFKVGLQLLARISEQAVTERVPVQPLGHGIQAEATAEETAPATEVRSPAAGAKKSYARNNRRDDALKRLSAIACMRHVTQDAERKVVVLSTSADVEVRLKALEVLAQLNTPATRDALMAMLHDPHRGVRLRSVLAMGANKITEAAPTLRKLLNEPDAEVGLSVAGALGQLDDWSGIVLVIRLLEEDGAHVQLAVRALSQITGHRFSTSREGIESARRYLATSKAEFLHRAREAV